MVTIHGFGPQAAAGEPADAPEAQTCWRSVLRQFLLRGFEKVRAEWAIVCTTRSEALTLAKTLREEGFLVVVTGPDGKTADETEEE
jgi:hypothetical protein